MSTYVLMKILESAPGRYDRGIRILTLNRLDKVYERLVSHIKEGQKVLDLGCGTGALTLRVARKGARVKGIDVNPQMLEIAQQRSEEQHLTQNIEWSEMGVAELGSEKSGDYDVVTSGLCFSELTEAELLYALQEVKRILKPGGLLLIADEVHPQKFLKSVLNGLIRFPLTMITYLLTQTTTRAVKNLPRKIEEAGLVIQSIRSNTMENFVEIVAKKPEEAPE